MQILGQGLILQGQGNGQGRRIWP